MMIIPDRPLTREELRQRVEQYHTEIAPWVRYMAMIDAFRPPPGIVLHDDGRLELGERSPLPSDSQAIWDRCQAMIETIRKSLFPEPYGGDA
jgi:hypothetical protein